MALGELFGAFESFGTISLAIKKNSQAPAVENKLMGALIPMHGVAGILVVAGIGIFGQVLDLPPTA
jgi:hypothetical protein